MPRKKKPDLSYDKAAVKRANERLRAMRLKYTDPKTGRPLYQENTAYLTRERDAIAEADSGVPSIYGFTKSGAVKYVSKKDFDKLSDTDKERFNRSLYSWLNADSSTKTGLQQAIDNNYELNKDQNALEEKGVTKDMWSNILYIYHNKIVPNDNSHYGSKVIIDATVALNGETMLSARDLEKAMTLIVNGRVGDIPKDWLKA